MLHVKCLYQKHNFVFAAGRMQHGEDDNRTGRAAAVPVIPAMI